DLGSFCLAQVALTETLFTGVVAAALLVVARAARAGRASPSAALLAGALCTAAAFVRPVAYYLAPLLAVGAFAWARRAGGTGTSPELHPETGGWTAAQLDARWRDEGLAILRAHPFLYARVWLEGALGTALSTGRGAALHLMGLPARSPAAPRGAAVASALLRAFAVLQLAVLYAGALRGVHAALAERPL